METGYEMSERNMNLLCAPNIIGCVIKTTIKFRPNHSLLRDLVSLCTVSTGPGKKRMRAEYIGYGLWLILFSELCCVLGVDFCLGPNVMFFVHLTTRIVY